MNEKILWMKKNNKYYSYLDIYSYRNKDILGPINNLISSGENVVHCMCNGKDFDKSVKMHTRKQDNGVYYNLANSKNLVNKHTNECPKINEDDLKKKLILKGRIYGDVDLETRLDLRESKKMYLNKKHGSINTKDKYSVLYGLGELLLSVANNSYIDKNHKVGKEHDVLSLLFRYYENGDTQGINTYLNNTIVDKKDNLTLGDVIFNPKWIKCDDKSNKTYTLIRSFKELNKRVSGNDDLIKQYALLKYKRYTIVGDNLARVELQARGKSTKLNYDKKIYVYINKFDFFKTLNMYKVSEGDINADYYISALLYENEGEMYVDQLSFIPVYPGYCIPIDNLSEYEIISQLLVWRDKITIKKVAKMDSSFTDEFKGALPDLILNIKGNPKPVLVELFELIIPEYYLEMLSKTKIYEELSKEGKCEFIGFYRNIGWNTPPLSTLLYPTFKTMVGLSKKIEYSISRLI